MGTTLSTSFRGAPVHAQGRRRNTKVFRKLLIGLTCFQRNMEWWASNMASCSALQHLLSKGIVLTLHNLLCRKLLMITVWSSD